MKKKLIPVLICSMPIFASLPLMAQKDNKGKDNNTLAYLSDSAAAIFYRTAKENGFLLREGMPQNFNQLQIGYNYGKGKFIPAQGSTQTQAQYLYTEGKTELSGIQLWGSFQLDKTREDSTRFAHQTRNNTTTPYYFGSPAFTSYRRNVYNMKVLAEKHLLKDNLPFVLGGDYRIGSHYSVNDPRGQINDFQFNLNAGLGYTIAKQFLMGINVMHGYGQERFNIGYKNSAYYESTLYPEYNNYLMNGYAEPIPKLETRKYQTNRTRNGLDITLKYTLSEGSTFALQASTQKEKQRSEYISEATSLALGTYDFTTRKMGILWDRHTATRHWIATMYYKKIAGKDRNYSFNGLNNYLYNLEEWNAKGAYSVKWKQHSLLNTSMQIMKLDEERIDGSFANKVHYGNWRIQPSIGVLTTLQNKNTWGIAIAPFMGFSPSSGNVLKISASSNGAFTNGLIYHDYLYNTATYIGGKLSGNYSIAYKDGIRIGLKLFLDYTAYTKLETINAPAALPPGKSRWNSGLSLCFYF